MGCSSVAPTCSRLARRGHQGCHISAFLFLFSAPSPVVSCVHMWGVCGVAPSTVEDAGVPKRSEQRYDDDNVHLACLGGLNSKLQHSNSNTAVCTAEQLHLRRRKARHYSFERPLNSFMLSDMPRTSDVQSRIPTGSNPFNKGVRYTILGRQMTGESRFTAVKMREAT